MSKRGMHMIREAAEAASRAFEAHWLKGVMQKREKRSKATDAVAVKRMRFATQAADIETVRETIR